MTTEADRTLLARSEEQYGVVSKRQALQAGLSVDQIKRRTASGLFEALFPGVFRIAGSPRTGRQRAQAALLWLGDAALISSLTAATLLRLDGCRTRDLHV